MSFTSQNYGVGKLKRMDRVLRDCIILSVSVSLALGVGVYVFGPEILQIYTTDPAVIQCAMEILLYTTVTYFLCGLMDLFPGALRGMGHSAVLSGFMVFSHSTGHWRSCLSLIRHPGSLRS